MYKHIGKEERDLIALWHTQGVSNKEIARRCGRSNTTIGRELKRNRSENGYYVSISAQARSEKRRSHGCIRHPLKNDETFSYVIDCLRLGWSPEIIAGRAYKKYGRVIICHETIYSFIYSNHPKAKELLLWQYLVRGQKKRRSIKGRRVQKAARIEARKSIHTRPAHVGTRQTIGHWESDTMEGKAHREGVHVEVERLTRKIFLKKISKVNSEETLQAQLDCYQTQPSFFLGTTTNDNGSENALHQELEKQIHVHVYFADPYSSWQKGTVENSIGLVRRYLPKKTDLSKISPREIFAIQEELNNRPRKVLNFNTSNEVFNSYLRGCTST